MLGTHIGMYVVFGRVYDEMKMPFKDDKVSISLPVLYIMMTTLLSPVLAGI